MAAEAKKDIAKVPTTSDRNFVFHCTKSVELMLEWCSEGRYEESIYSLSPVRMLRDVGCRKRALERKDSGGVRGQKTRVRHSPRRPSWASSSAQPDARGESSSPLMGFLGSFNAGHFLRRFPGTTRLLSPDARLSLLTRKTYWLPVWTPLEAAKLFFTILIS